MFTASTVTQRPVIGLCSLDHTSPFHLRSELSARNVYDDPLQGAAGACEGRVAWVGAEEGQGGSHVYAQQMPWRAAELRPQRECLLPMLLWWDSRNDLGLSDFGVAVVTVGREGEEEVVHGVRWERVKE